MVSEPLRYVTIRRNRDGSERFYWQRRGFDLIRLPADPVERLARVNELNAAADAGATVIAVNTVAWCIADLQTTEEWDRLSPTTKRIYKKWLDFYHDKLGRLTPSGAITRAFVKQLMRRLRSQPSTCRHAIAALSLICEVAREHELMSANPCHKLKMPKGGKRTQVFTDEDCEAFLAACERKEIRDAFMVLRYTAMRPIDILKLPGTAYDGKKIAFRQQKTGLGVWIHCHKELRSYIARYMTPLGKTLINWRGNQPLPQRDFNEGFREVLTAAGLDHLQARDLRRTAVCMLDDAGCSPSQIASVTGHSEQTIHRMLEVYRPKLAGVSEIAVKKWERRKKHV